MEKSRLQNMILFEGGIVEKRDQALILEEPLSIRIDGKPYSVVMRTPGDELAHAAGFCLSEGLVETPDDFATLGFCTEDGVNVVTATLAPERRRQVRDILNRQGFISQTSCGICGKELLSDLYQIVKPVDPTMTIDIDQAQQCIRLTPLSWAEDGGRHNARDKAIGKSFLDGRLEQLRVGAMSSRLSFELVQKAARAGLEIMVSMSRPTALAVELAQSLNMTLACLGKKRGFMIFCGKERILLPT